VGETPEEIAETFQYAVSKSVPLCCSSQRRFDPSYVASTRAAFIFCRPPGAPKEVGALGRQQHIFESGGAVNPLWRRGSLFIATFVTA